MLLAACQRTETLKHFGLGFDAKTGFGTQRLNSSGTFNLIMKQKANLGIKYFLYEFTSGVLNWCLIIKIQA